MFARGLPPYIPFRRDSRNVHIVDSSPAYVRQVSSFLSKVERQVKLLVDKFRDPLPLCSRQRTVEVT